MDDKNKIKINFRLDFIDKKPNANPIILRKQNDTSLFFINFHMFFCLEREFRRCIGDTCMIFWMYTAICHILHTRFAFSLARSLRRLGVGGKFFLGKKRLFL